MQDADDVCVKHAHKSRDGIGSPDGESNGDVGKSEGNRNGCCDCLKLRVFQIGAQSSEGRDHEDQEPVVKRKMKVQRF